MTPDTDPVPGGDPAQLEEQLILYAKELHTLYREEKKEREALAEEKLVLEYKLRELTALNTLFQKHLARREDLEDALERVIQGLRKLLAQPPGDLRPQLQALLAAAEAALANPPAQRQATDYGLRATGSEPKAEA